jgi:hypothetical protein
MAIAIQVQPALREALRTPEAEAALIDLLNQFHAEQRNGFERSLEMHLQAIKEYLGHYLAEADAKNEKRFAEADAKNEKRFAEADVKNEKRFNEVEKRFNEADVKNEKRFAELQVAFETKMAQNHASLIRWMFAFFIGAIFSLASLLFVYFQLLVKVKP